MWFIPVVLLLVGSAALGFQAGQDNPDADGIFDAEPKSKVAE
jgi:hypothetical protein